MTSSDMLWDLERVYGTDPDTLAAQKSRYEIGLGTFRARYGPGPVHIYHAPGRVNLIGEHTDYNHGYVLPMALDKDTLVFARRRPDSVVRLANVETHFTPRQFTIAAKIPPRTIGDWSNYAQGPAQLLAAEFGELHGYDALVDGSPGFGVPRGAGLSSSSALVVSHAVTLVGLNQLPLKGTALADACGRAEWYVGTRGGIMDQFISILGQRDHALFLDCRPTGEGTTYHYTQVSIPAGYAIVVVDSGVRHHNTGPLFNRRVAEGRIGVRLLQRHYPGITHLRDVGDVPWTELEPLLPDVIHSDELRAMGIDPDTILDSGVSAETDTYYVRRRCRHVITENARVLASVRALRGGDIATFGELLRQAHTSARDDYQISTPEIEALVEIARRVPSTVGARLTGAGWGGCIVALVAQDRTDAFRKRIERAYRRRVHKNAKVFVCRSAAGAGLVHATTV